MRRRRMVVLESRDTSEISDHDAYFLRTLTVCISLNIWKSVPILQYIVDMD